MSKEEKIDGYMKIIRDTIKTCLDAGDYIGSVTFQVNVKGSEINNMNIDHRESIKIA